MSVWDDWDLWLTLAGVDDEPDPADDPWGAIDVALTPLSDAQREHLRLAEPTLLDGLGDLDAVGADETIGGTGSVSAELAEAFAAIDEFADHDDSDGPDGTDVTP